MHRLLVNYSRPWDSQSEYCGDNYQDASKWHYRVANATHRAMDPQISPINTDLRPVAQCGSVEFARGMQCDDTPCSARRNGHYRIANTTHRGMDPQISPINTDLRPVAQCGSVEFACGTRFHDTGASNPSGLLRHEFLRTVRAFSGRAQPRSDKSRLGAVYRGIKTIWRPVTERASKSERGMGKQAVVIRLEVIRVSPSPT